jgi:glycosyltransferase XagB
MRLARRGLLRHAWILAFTPIYWFLLSWAAWRALFQLLSDPLKWEKPNTDWPKTQGYSASASKR